MKVYPFKIPKPENNALIYQEDIELVFYDKLHQHDEIQISFIEKGTGTLVIGDSVCSYNTGNIFVIGSNLPHAFKSDKSSDDVSVMKTLFFTKTSFGEHFFDLNELKEIKSFFIKAEQGIFIESKIKEIQQHFYQLIEASKLERFLLLLKILKLITLANTEVLTNFVNPKQYSDNEGKRLRTIFEYTIENAHQKITLEEISAIANMTKNAFCKYFKKRTNKTYFNFLTEVRVENACKYLRDKEEYSIAEIAYKSGFNNISNFNRKFKAIKKTTPTAFSKA